MPDSKTAARVTGYQQLLLGFAVLTLSMRPTQFKILSSHLLGLHVSNVDNQHYSNVAWSLAVMGCLQFSMLSALLSSTSCVWESMAPQGTLSQATIAAATQLHQA